ncbi:FkbM family methyltransferase [Flavihumibacter sp. R14]|nr:FkbM family methyltransferase [Flavihumibacter soli]
MRNYLKRILKSSENQVKTQYLKTSYSQCGEDLLVDYIFQLRGVQLPTYIDCGAHHPYFLSNTARFYEKGSRGINIEANSSLLRNFEQHRPEDININVGLSDKKSEMDFYIMKDETLSTFSKTEADYLITSGKGLLEIKKVTVTTLSDIVERYCQGIFPDFLNIDIEGMDFQIIDSLDFDQTFPKVICVESAEYSPIGAGAKRNELINLLVSKGYYEYANTNLNAIMVKNEFWFI